MDGQRNVQKERQMVSHGPPQFSAYNPLVLGFLSAAATTQPEITSDLWHYNVLLHDKILSYLFCNLPHDHIHHTVISHVYTVIKSKFVPVHVMKAYGGRRYVAPLMLNLSTRWKCVVTFAHVQL